FAVRAADTFGASEGLPAYLRVAGEVLMGRAPDGPLLPGEAWRIPTGGMLPEGADAVVMVEHTEEAGDAVAVLRPVAPEENVVRRGDDVRAGQVVLQAGKRLRPHDIGLLAACGVTRVPVRRRPVVGIIGTGDEVVAAEAVPGPGQVRDVNTPALAAAVKAAGGDPRVFGLVPDELPVLREVLARAVAESELVLLSGGSSVGTRDLTLEAVSSLPGALVLFHGLAVKPGKPTVGAVADGKAVFGLPGHPVSALVVFEFLVRPLLEPERSTRPPVRVRLGRSLRSAPGREDYVRVALRIENGELVAEPVLGKSGLIATLARADGLVRLRLDAEGAAAGEMVEYFPL
ncbi:MAG: molybdopterin molybdotransferase MoeA, partial [Thermoanaerobacteraceae bacterium]|nr:molybdopterin molybdotransferase MoeA [Thermoanaerobacteraceae bacterium]